MMTSLAKGLGILVEDADWSGMASEYDSAGVIVSSAP
jgi:hypothetical protein